MTPAALAVSLAHELAVAVHAPEARAREVAAALVTAGAGEAEARELLVVAWRESSLRPAVERCDVRGAAGEVGLWQERAPAGGALCAGGAVVQARAAVAHWRRCDGESAERHRAYLGRRAVDREARTRADLVEQMAAVEREP